MAIVCARIYLRAQRRVDFTKIMVVAIEKRRSSVSFFGRLADELTRETLELGLFTAALKDRAAEALYKHDGYFVFADLGPPGEIFDIALGGHFYRERTLVGVATAAAMVELAAPGEDEVFVVATDVNTTEQEIRFRQIPFLPSILEGAALIGESAVSTTLAETLEGRNVELATLADVSGITAGMTLRIVRSPRLIMTPNAYYAYPADTTLAVLTVVEDNPDATPIPDATLHIDEVDDVEPTVVNCGALDVRVVDFPAPVSERIALGPARRVQARTDVRGTAAFFFTPEQPVTKLDITVSKPGHVATPVTMNLTTAGRTSEMVVLPRV
jgi:hypothetical protein